MSELASIEQLTTDYFRSLHEGDLETIRRLYHPACMLMCGDGRDINTMTMAQYLEVVSERVPPKEAGQPLFGSVVSIDLAGSETAMVKVNSAVQPRFFEDYLTLAKEAGAWKIVAKVYRVISS
ncbi:nuclear transport factor 2 family protein [Parendozoicomonas haliclonae]|uniref:Putative lumazine-binding protein n=1 Tax=Parendozoicomonas haliclonae TaxID=1960125 RepID=A0A1X7ANP7_9GAMM|nr:nuclear transport factor 2 family protein [Parendozoicomonas haliclonae]SMA49924.1 putative lumazine-binding protein [Parendozoicomonas haliclonae]